MRGVRPRRRRYPPRHAGELPLDLLDVAACLRVPTDEGGASLRTKEPRPYGRRRRVPTDEGGASLRTKEPRPYGRRSRVPTDEGAASPRLQRERRTAFGRTPQAAASGARVSAAERSFASSSRGPNPGEGVPVY
ncbi:MAG: hypothetical protein LBG27_04480 [Spirochaetaceae bacterium]|nr:hypothetical protein [Spirochaetaceae bacterium]